jgi:hypothetical protein
LTLFLAAETIVRTGATSTADAMNDKPQEPSPFRPADNPVAIEHIKLLQGIVNRLANNSASCKTWCLTLVAALLSLAGMSRNPAVVPISLVPVVVFGFIDTMYLAQERAYRDLYKRMVGKMQDGSYALTDAFEASAPISFTRFCRAFLSWSIWPIYAGLIAAYIVAKCTGALVWLAR